MAKQPMTGTGGATFVWASLCKTTHVFLYGGDPRYVPLRGWPCACGMTRYGEGATDDR